MIFSWDPSAEMRGNLSSKPFQIFWIKGSLA
jgi:hypothetical protein